MTKRKRRNNGGSGKNALRMDFYATVTVMDADKSSPIYSIKETSVDNAISELMRLNNVKLKQLDNTRLSQHRAQTKICEDLFCGGWP